MVVHCYLASYPGSSPTERSSVGEEPGYEAMVISGCAWLSVVMYGYQWLCMVISRFLWLSMVVSGYVWLSLHEVSTFKSQLRLAVNCISLFLANVSTFMSR